MRRGIKHSGVVLFAVGAALFTGSVAEARPLAHCTLDGSLISTDGAATFSEGTASCVGTLGGTTVAPGHFPYRLEGQMGAPCASLGSLIATLTFQARRLVTVGMHAGVPIRADVSILGVSPGLVTGNGDDGREGLSVSGSAPFGLCGDRLHLDLVLTGNGGEARSQAAPTTSADESSRQPAAKRSARRCRKRANGRKCCRKAGRKVRCAKRRR